MLFKSCQIQVVSAMIFYLLKPFLRGRGSGLMVSALVSGASSSGSSPGQGHCVVILGKTLYSHGASLHQRCTNEYRQLNAGGNPAMD